MAWLANDPTDFADEMIEGFVEASRRWVSAGPGGVIRSGQTAEPCVAVVIGGGSGHYPAFVGHGLAHGAAMGNVFASPSAQQIYDIARAVERGRGVLLSYGNYAGDVLNFTLAEQRLRSDVDVMSVPVGDDISSAPVDERGRRRGIAGDLAVFKIAGAAAERGLDLADVARLAQRAAERTRTLGVAFSGCTLPGADAPLFTVPDGKMAIGLGIHGESGISEIDRPTADAVAELLVGVLWGLALRILADQFDDHTPPTTPNIADGVRAAAAAIQDFGKAKIGDATMVDALAPFAATLTREVAAGRPLAPAWVSAAAAKEGADATALLVPAMGRARTHAEESVGTPDAGAISLAMIVQAVGELLTERNNSHE